ncbi:unnamed protein product, partial [Timema podura]|nr:unnamed protein product [Timema podura]
FSDDGFPEIGLIPKKVLEKEKETDTAKPKHALVLPLDMDMWEVRGFGGNDRFSSRGGHYLFVQWQQCKV